MKIRFLHMKSAVVCAVIIGLLAGCSNMMGKQEKSESDLLQPGASNAASLPEETSALIQKADAGCPCTMPDYEDDEKYMVSDAEETSRDEYTARIEEQGLDTMEKRRAQVMKYQEMFLKARSETGKPAEQYLMNALEKKGELNEKIPTQGLEDMRKVLVANIDEVSSLLVDFQNELDPVFFEFMRAELKVLIQVRKSVIDELEKR